MVFSVIISSLLISSAFRAGRDEENDAYTSMYFKTLHQLSTELTNLERTIESASLDAAGRALIQKEINSVRLQMKVADFWMRYLEPVPYKQINSPLPVEWETEVWEKFEKPYKHEGAGLTLAALYLEEPDLQRGELVSLIHKAIPAVHIYLEDSVSREIGSYHHFYLANRLYLLNLAAIYTTGFECPDTSRIIPELRYMMEQTLQIYAAFNADHPEFSLNDEYLDLYHKTLAFVNAQPSNYSDFNHYEFIRNYINPLFGLNQEHLRMFKVISTNLTDYALNKKADNIFSKEIYSGQNTKGIYLRVNDPAAMQRIEALGKLLFYDPILSGNNERACVSCHKPDKFLSDGIATAETFNHQGLLTRNTPSLLNVEYNQLLMADGAQHSLEAQAAFVMSNPQEMGSDLQQTMEKILSCPDYKSTLTEILPFTPFNRTISMDHVISALMVYYTAFSDNYAAFDRAMQLKEDADADVVKGFNLFMSRAQCATCHFVPFFNGVKPPYVGSEFEVLGVPNDTLYTALSTDLGRYLVNPADETHRAFRTTGLKNIAQTAPYMHNGVFKTLEQVVEFYNTGGGAGHGLDVPNQTLSADSLHLTIADKQLLIAFMHALDEEIVADTPPAFLPVSEIDSLNRRKTGGVY